MASNHIHVIANTSAPYKLENTIRDFKAHTARQMLERLQDKSFPESRRDWLLYLFKYFARKLRGTQEHQVWVHDNHPIELFSEKVVIQKLRYIHNNPVRAKLVVQAEDWVYSSARNYAEGHGIYDVCLLWTGFDEDGGWFFGNVQAPALD